MIAIVELERYGLPLLFVWADAPAKSPDERFVVVLFLFLNNNASHLFDESPVRQKTVLICSEFICSLISIGFFIFMIFTSVKTIF